ncbi:MAG: ATP-binding cassette domain-containing protein, partial [Candidatus Sericytochromatia bacterium]
MVERSIVIDIEGLTKHFYLGFWRRRVQVLNGVDLQVYQNETFGLLGPNGAGKTTTLKALVGLVKPTDGNVRILGKSPWNPRIRQHIGYLPEQPYIYGYLTGHEYLQLCGRIFHLSARQLRPRIAELLELVKLSDRDARKQIRTYSKG